MASQYRGFWGEEQRTTANHLDISPLRSVVAAQAETD